MYFVYLLRLVNGSIYTGSTPDLEKRQLEHKNGKSLATRRYRPVKLIWYCALPTRLQALRFERYLKTGSGQAFRNRHLI